MRGPRLEPRHQEVHGNFGALPPTIIQFRRLIHKIYDWPEYRNEIRLYWKMPTVRVREITLAPQSLEVANEIEPLHRHSCIMYHLGLTE